jgi:hypothetical protein
MSYMQLIGVGVVPTWRRRENKNHENFFWRANMQIREILHQKKFPAIRYLLVKRSSKVIYEAALLQVQCQE